MHAKSTASENEIAWAAGLFEGEGCIKTGHDKTGRAYAYVTLTTTDKDVMDYFHAVVGIGEVRPSPPRQAGYKATYRWSGTRTAEVVILLESFLPYLGLRRSVKAMEALVICEGIKPRSKTHCPEGHKFTDENTWWEVVPPAGRRQRRCRTCMRERMRKYHKATYVSQAKT
jgi:hypothetical protein